MKRFGNGVCAFGQTYANELRRRRPRCGDKWHLDEVFLTIRGERHSLWRAVDQNGNVLDILVQSRRNKHAARRFFRKLRVRLQYVPRVIITDKLKSYGAAKREILQGWEHRQHARVEQSCGTFNTNPRDCVKRRCGASSPPNTPNAFSRLIAPIAGHFQPRRHRLRAEEYRAILQDRFQTWNEVTGVKLVA